MLRVSRVSRLYTIILLSSPLSSTEVPLTVVTAVMAFSLRRKISQRKVKGRARYHKCMKLSTGFSLSTWTLKCMLVLTTFFPLLQHMCIMYVCMHYDAERLHCAQ